MKKEYTHFVLDEKNTVLFNKDKRVATLKTWDVMNKVADGIEDDQKFGTTEDHDQVAPYFTDDDVVGWYYDKEIDEELERRGFKKVGDKDGIIKLKKILEE